MAGRDDERNADTMVGADGSARPPARRAERRAGRAPDEQPARPRIEDEPSILGLTRRANSRFGSRLFTLFFVLVYAVIVIQLLVALADG